MSVIELSRRLAAAVQGATFEEQELVRSWFYGQDPTPTSLEDAPEDIQELIERLEEETPTGLTVDGETISDGPQIISAADGYSDPRALLSATVSDTTVSVAYPGGESESYEFASGSIKTYSAGGLQFIDKNTGTSYIIREIDDSDGYWLSSYQSALPGEALASLVSHTEEGRTVNYLENDDEEMIAFQTPGQDDIDTLMYVNKFGRWIRASGEWFRSAHDDDSIDDTRAYEVNKDTVQDFLQVFDSGPLSAGDVKKYLTLTKG